MPQTTPKRIEGTSNTNSGPNDRSDIQAFVRQITNLPDDFLRLPNQVGTDTVETQLGQNVTSNLSGPLAAGNSNETAAVQASISDQQSNEVNMLDVTVVEANLVKNYGFLRMDCYCRIRVGHNVCETQTCLNGAKNPRWNGVFHFYLQPGIDSFHLALFDEKQFSADEKIAWLDHEIPRDVYQGITVEQWFPLSGRLGENKEGSILLVMSLKKVPYRSNRGANRATGPSPIMMMPAQSLHGNQSIITTAIPNSGPQIPIYVQPNPAPGQQVSVPSPTPQPITQSDIDQMHEMFPNVEKDVIKSILEDNLGDKNSAISALLSLNDRSN